MKSKISILFLGKVFPDDQLFAKEIEPYIVSNMQEAADCFQKNIIDGLLAYYSDVSIFSMLPIDSWPLHYKKAYNKKLLYTFKGAEAEIMPTCNITCVKQIINPSIVFKCAKQWCDSKGSTIKKVVICYTPSLTFMKSLNRLKKRYKELYIVQVIADIPEFAENDNSHGIKAILRKSRVKKLNELNSIVDGYVLLTEHMAQKMCIRKPYVVVEGICSYRQTSERIQKSDETIKVLYSGSLNIKYGIKTLLDAFSAIKDDRFRLIICGLGNAESLVNSCAKNDKRIKYLGKLKHEEVLHLQQECDILINPRQNLEEFCKYSFPSKIMEFLSSGTITIAYRLDGIPQEYYHHFISPNDNSSLSLSKTIVTVGSLPKEERQKRGLSAQRFVLEQKNPVKQVGRIARLIEKILFSNEVYL